MGAITLIPNEPKVVIRGVGFFSISLFTSVRFETKHVTIFFDFQILP
jgi:hypothetical protein